jgi:hypothetical protein
MYNLLHWFSVFPLLALTPVFTIFNISMHPKHMIRLTEIVTSLLMPHEVPPWNFWISIYPKSHAFVICISILKIHFSCVHLCEMIIKQCVTMLHISCLQKYVVTIALQVLTTHIATFTTTDIRNMQYLRIVRPPPLYDPYVAVPLASSQQIGVVTLYYSQNHLLTLD